MRPRTFCLPPEEFIRCQYNIHYISTKLYLKHEVGLEFLINLFRLGLDGLDVLVHLLLGRFVCPAAVVLWSDVSPQSPAVKTLIG